MKEQQKKGKLITKTIYWGNDARPIFNHNDAYGWQDWQLVTDNDKPQCDCGA